MRPMGLNRLPVGYIGLEFLESTGIQRVEADYPSDGRTAWSLRVEETAAAVSFPYASTLDVSARLGVATVNGRWRFDYASFMQPTMDVALNTVYELALNKNRQCVINGQVVHTFPTVDFNGLPYVSLFAANGGSYPFTGRIWFYRAEKDGAEKLELIPALDPAGTPCMFDLVSRQPFHNKGTGQFIAGLTLAQALKLKALPAKTATPYHISPGRLRISRGGHGIHPKG